VRQQAPGHQSGARSLDIEAAALEEEREAAPEEERKVGRVVFSA